MCQTMEKSWKICVFIDACSTSFGTAVYVIAEDENKKRHSNLVFAKSKVKSLNKNCAQLSEDLSIPRMELLGCYIGAVAGDFCKKAFEKEYPNVQMKYFTDSLITLYRIHNDPTTYKVWVANRLIMIQKMTKKHEWYFCEGHLNFPGDTASRGAKLSDFIEKKEWLSGPSFLTDPDHVYTTLDQLKLSQKEKLSDANEKKKVLPTSHHTFVSHNRNIHPEAK